MNTKTTIAIFAAVAVLAAVVAPSFVSQASAKITSQTTDTSCTNGGGLTQESTTENVNPSGSAPPGQNK
jgi:uncharacterized membrane protein